MGLGKTLEVITLILTNFVDGKPLAVPVPGKMRESRLLSMKEKLEVRNLFNFVLEVTVQNAV